MDNNKKYYLSSLIRGLYQPNPNALKVISLGWGVQSFTLAAMVALGKLEKVDYVIHADTTHEASWTYEFAEKYTKWFADRGIEVITVKPDNKKLKAYDEYKGVFIPAYTDSEKGGGMLRRQCTGDWKIAPMRRYVQSIRKGKPIEMWLGITTDEAQRMKNPDVKYIVNRWPLIEMGMSRNDCGNWLTKHKLDIPGRSACSFCPFHDTAEWREVMASEPDRKAAIEHDYAIRKIRPPFDLYIHPSRQPIDEIDFRSEIDKGQLTLWDNECDGVCGI